MWFILSEGRGIDLHQGKIFWVRQRKLNICYCSGSQLKKTSESAKAILVSSFVAWKNVQLWIWRDIWKKLGSTISSVEKEALASFHTWNWAISHPGKVLTVIRKNAQFQLALPCSNLSISQTNNHAIFLQGWYEFTSFHSYICQNELL